MQALLAHVVAATVGVAWISHLRPMHRRRKGIDTPNDNLKDAVCAVPYAREGINESKESE
jgi:hypothetical protein